MGLGQLTKLDSLKIYRANFEILSERGRGTSVKTPVIRPQDSHTNPSHLGPISCAADANNFILDSEPRSIIVIVLSPWKQQAFPKSPVLPANF